MATLVLATEPVDQPTWEIQREAFVPPSTRRIIRGWDRAPVPARAPRLHGQKVWKKVGLKATSIEDTRDEAQEELQKEGAGARKKSRMLKARENINNAMWAEAIPNESAKDMASTLDSSGGQSENLNTPAAHATDGSNAEVEIPPSHEEVAPNAAKQDQLMDILQFIPRKRTNTDHVITPKKTLRQTTLDHKEQVPSGTEHITKVVAKTTRPRKSLRKSMIGSISDNASDRMTSKAQIRLSSSAKHLPNIESRASGNQEPEASVGESTSKRRVLRRSTTTRRSIAHVEQPSNAGHIGSQSTESSQRDANTSIASGTVQSTPSNELVTSIGPDELPINGNRNLCDISGLDLTLPLEAANECLRNLSHILMSSTEIEAQDTVDTKPSENSNTGNDVEQVQDVHMVGGIPDAVKMMGDQIAGISESQKSSSEPENPAASMIAEEKLVAHHDTSNADGVAATTDGGSLEGHITTASPTHSGSTSSLESGDKISSIESDISLKPPAELDIHQDIQNIEAPDVLDSSNMATTYDHDDTDMLRNFLTRVKANKAAKNPPKRKRSLPHSPLRIPLGDLDNNASPSPLQLQKGNEFDVAEPSPSKRKKKPSPLAHCENEPEPRRSGRTKPPIKEPLGAPSFIPVRRLGQDIDTTVTLKRNEEKELAALTRVNTRKNKGNALTALEVLAKKSEEKEDPVMRQRLLKEVFDEKMEKGRQCKEKGREKKSVTWAEELAQFQTLTKGKPEEDPDDKEKEKVVVVQSGEDRKHGAVRVGVRSKVALSMALNGTPAPKRKMRGRI